MAAEGLAADLAIKLEFFNPLGSVKDRIGLAMVEAAEREGRIAPGRSTLVEPTSGNTGIALAFVAAAKGYRLIVVMPETAPIERRKMLRLMGAEVELTPRAAGMARRHRRAEAIVAAHPRRLDAAPVRQPGQPRHPRRHHGGGDLGDTAGKVDIVVAGVGTGGTLTGVARALKPRKPGLRSSASSPTESAVLSGGEPGPHGIQGIGAGFKPAVLDLDLIDAVVPRRRTRGDRRRPPLRRRWRASGRHLLRRRAARGAGGGGRYAGGAASWGIAPSFAERYLSTALVRGAIEGRQGRGEVSPGPPSIFPGFAR